MDVVYRADLDITPDVVNEMQDYVVRFERTLRSAAVTRYFVQKTHAVMGTGLVDGEDEGEEGEEDVGMADDEDALEENAGAAGTVEAGAAPAPSAVARDPRLQPPPATATTAGAPAAAGDAAATTAGAMVVAADQQQVVAADEPAGEAAAPAAAPAAAAKPKRKHKESKKGKELPSLQAFPQLGVIQTGPGLSAAERISRLLPAGTKLRTVRCGCYPDDLYACMHYVACRWCGELQ